MFSKFSFSQTTAEWTQQKKTQIKYVVQQIVAFQTYLSYVKKGYDIAHKGITTVQNIKNGEWNLHKDFFGSLKIVNPSIEKYAKVADIIAMQIRILKQSKSFLNKCRQEGQFNSEELANLKKVCDKLLSECLRNIDELVMVTTSGELEMKDDERIKRIEKIYADMQDNYVFFRSFSGSMAQLSNQRLREKLEIELSEKLNGLNR